MLTIYSKDVPTEFPHRSLQLVLHPFFFVFTKTGVNSCVFHPSVTSWVDSVDWCYFAMVGCFCEVLLVWKLVDKCVKVHRLKAFPHPCVGCCVRGQDVQPTGPCMNVSDGWVAFSGAFFGADWLLALCVRTTAASVNVVWINVGLNMKNFE